LDYRGANVRLKSTAVADGKGYVLVVDLATGSLIRAISTNEGSVDSPSGLARVNIEVEVEDFSSDNTAVAAYGGDLYGNMWKFDLISGAGHDALAGLVLHQPGLPPQPVILRLLVSDEGKVDRVLVEDSFLGSDIERQVNEALSRVMFEPGKIGRIAVRSQMRVEARLEPVVRPIPIAAGAAD